MKVKDDHNFLELLGVLRKLRAPGGCDWDRAQTAESLVPYLLEETYEVIESIDRQDYEGLKEELGDLCLHVLFQAELAKDKGQFEISDSLYVPSDSLRRVYILIPSYASPSFDSTLEPSINLLYS